MAIVTISNVNVPRYTKWSAPIVSARATVDDGANVFLRVYQQQQQPTNFTGPVNVTIPAKDLREMQDITDFFSRITQAARAGGVLSDCNIKRCDLS